MYYTPPESTSYAFVLRPNGELRSYVTHEVLSRLFQDSSVVIDPLWSKKDYLKHAIKQAVFLFAEDDDHPATVKYHWYIGMNENSRLVPIPFAYRSFNLSSFKSKCCCLKAIKKLEKKFSQDDLRLVFCDI